MTPFTNHTGITAAMDRSNVDTDQIIPKQFLKRIERTGFGKFLFFDWRFDESQHPIPGFELNQGKADGASILLVRNNFGSGSSREHAVWALADYGFRCVIGESFGDIFFNNCFKNGVLPIKLPATEIENLFQMYRAEEQLELSIDLEKQTVKGPSEFTVEFTIDDFRKDCLLNGLDDIGLTLQHLDKIESFEKARGMTSVDCPA